MFKIYIFLTLSLTMIGTTEETSKSVKDLEYGEYFLNFEKIAGKRDFALVLFCKNRELNNLDGLSTLVSQNRPIYVDLEGNKLRNIRFNERVPGIKILNFSSNEIRKVTNEDLIGLERNFPDLETLLLSKNPLSDDSREIINRFRGQYSIGIYDK